MFGANFAIFEPETRMSVRATSTLSFSPWMRTVPFLSKRYSLWLDIANRETMFWFLAWRKDAKIDGIARSSRAQGMGAAYLISARHRSYSCPSRIPYLRLGLCSRFQGAGCELT